MSASPVFSSAAVGRPFIFPDRMGTHTTSSSSPDGMEEEESSPRGANELSPALPGWVKRGSEASSAGTAEALPRFPPGGVLLSRGEMQRIVGVITPASRLEVRPAPDFVSSGIRELDALIGGFPRGCLTEICGKASSGRTSVLFAALAHATRRGEVCALVDASDTMHPASAAAAGIQLERLLWIRCKKTILGSRFSVPSSPKHNFIPSNLEHVERRGCESQLDQVLKVTDLLLQSNGFGMIVLDLSDIPARSTRRIPLASWFRFRRAVEHTPTVLLILEQQPIAGSCSSVLMKVTGKQHSALSTQHSENRLSHAELLDEFEINAELLRSRLERKSPQSAAATFSSRAAWAS